MTRCGRFSSLVVTVAGLLFLLGALPTQAQERGNTVPRTSPNAMVGQTIGITEMNITYGRPHVRGRDIFGELVSYDEVWRTGANEATTISFSTPVQIEGKSLDAGTYSFFTIPGENTWTLIFNNKAEQWGAYNYDSSKDALRIKVEPEPAPPRKMMSFYVHSVTDTTATAFLHWAETRVPFQISVNTMEVLRKRANKKMANTDKWKALLPYIGYALENEMLLDDALKWADRSIELKETFQNLRMKAYVLAAQKNHKQAVKTANAALSKAEGMDEAPNGMEELQKKVESWKSM